jgi:hypothetical protein
MASQRVAESYDRTIGHEVVIGLKPVSSYLDAGILGVVRSREIGNSPI